MITMVEILGRTYRYMPGWTRITWLAPQKSLSTSGVTGLTSWQTFREFDVKGRARTAWAFFVLLAEKHDEFTQARRRGDI